MVFFPSDIHWSRKDHRGIISYIFTPKSIKNWTSNCVNWQFGQGYMDAEWKSTSEYVDDIIPEVSKLLAKKPSDYFISTEFTTKQLWINPFLLQGYHLLHIHSEVHSNISTNWSFELVIWSLIQSIFLMFLRYVENRSWVCNPAGRKTFWVFI